MSRCRYDPDRECGGCAPGDCEAPHAGEPLPPPPLMLGIVVVLGFLCALLLLLSCSSPPPVPSAVDHIPEGDYTLRAYADRSEGACDWLDRTLTTGLHVDAAGQIASPLPGANCVTTYGDWIAFVCEGFGSKLTAHGVLEPSGAQGTGEVRGNIGGCTYAAFTFQLVRR